MIETGTRTKMLSDHKNNKKTKQYSNTQCGFRDGELITPESAGFDNYAFNKRFNIDTKTKKRVLITGAGSYVGESFKTYAKKNYPDNFDIATVSTTDCDWQKSVRFELYDCVYHVAGIAHVDVGNVDEETKRRYYSVNTDLAIDTANLCRDAGVKQFIFMSSAIIYGGSAPYGREKCVSVDTLPSPDSIYGDSKWQADKGVRELARDGFNVAVIRAPMIYGKGSKGNYSILSKIAKRLAVFPNVYNQRSMLHIDNLCEFLCQLILCGEGGIFFPQNAEYTKTADMVKEIRKAAGKKTVLTRFFNPVLKLVSFVPGKVGQLTNKAFGNLTYDQQLSQYQGLVYHVHSFYESIQLTEGTESERVNETCSKSIDEKKHILVITQYFYPEQFRINDMVHEWVKRGYKVTVLTGIPNYPMGKYFEGYDLKHHRHEIWNSVEIIRIPIIARGSSSIGMIANYVSFVVSGFFWNLVNSVRYDLVFMFEVSPMTQCLIGVWYKKKHHIPLYLYVQDLWPENVEIVTGIHSQVVLKPIGYMVNKIYRSCDHIFATSPSFVKEIQKRCPGEEKKVSYWPQYAEEFYRPIPRTDAMKNCPEIPNNDSFKIIFTGNIGKAQGLDILPKAAKLLKEQNLNKPVSFIIVGDGREQYNFVATCREAGVENMFVMTGRKSEKHIPDMVACCDAAILTFMDNELFTKTIPAKLQSYMACGIPIIASVSGESKRIIQEACCGLCSSIGDEKSLADNIRLMMDNPELCQMGINARKFFEKNYDKQLLMDQIEQYLR